MAELNTEQPTLQESLKSAAYGDTLSIETAGSKISGQLLGRIDALVELHLEDGQVLSIYRNSCRIGQTFQFKLKGKLRTSNHPVENIELISAQNNVKLPHHKEYIEQVSTTMGLDFQKLKAASLHPASQSLSPNPDLDRQHEYEALRLNVTSESSAYQGYEHIDGAHRYSELKPEDSKFEIENDSPNLGWKAHLNVSISNTEQVSKYLIENGYHHKFLYGGEIADGKTFSIYFGSRVMVDKWAKVISKDLEGLLAKPEVKAEVELAKGIVGRFTCREQNHPSYKKYTPYGDMGIVLLKEEYRRLRRLNNSDGTRYLQRPTEAELQKAFSELEQDFGQFFLGGV